MSGQEVGVVFDALYTLEAMSCDDVPGVKFTFMDAETGAWLSTWLPVADVSLTMAIEDAVVGIGAHLRAYLVEALKLDNAEGAR